MKCVKFKVHLHIPDTVSAGTFLYPCVWIEPDPNDVDTTNNSRCWVQQVILPYDPNLKLNFTADNPLGGPIYDDDITQHYQIQFQNTGDDTAKNVIVYDTLDADLNVQSILAGASSHPYELGFEGNNVLVFKLYDINLPPVDTDEANSWGFVSFSIDRGPDMVYGDEIHNRGAVYFDQNAPVFTNTVVNTLLPDAVEISGYIYTEEGLGVGGATVSTGLPLQRYGITNAEGFYAIDSLQAYQTYSVTPYKNSAPDNGLSTYDLVLIRQHILGISELPSMYKLIAADGNNDGWITTFDLVRIQQVLLKNVSEFPENTSWRFVPADFTFKDPIHPMVFPEQVIVPVLFNDTTAKNFIGVKIGDVDASADPLNISSVADVRDANAPASLLCNDHAFEAGEIVTLVLQPKHEEAIAGIQFSVNFDTKILQYTNIGRGGNIAGYTMVNDNATRSVANLHYPGTTKRPIHVQAMKRSLFCNFKALQSGYVSEVTQISDAILPAAAFDAQGQAYNMVLDCKKPEHFRLLQNQPNPFSGTTVIPFILPEADDVHLTIYDVHGRVIYEQSRFFDKGYQQWEVTASVRGLYFYTVTSGEFRETKKMVMD